MICPVCSKEHNNKRFCSRKCVAHSNPCRPFLERFWSKVIVGLENECWPWIGATNPDGYGSFLVGSKKNGTSHRVPAHQVAWELKNALPFPEGKDTLHSCDNPPCCNANHISPGTRLENMRDCMNKDRTCRGERRPQSKLTDAIVTRLRQEKPYGRIDAVSNEIGVSKYTIYDALNGRTWKHLPL